MNTANLQLEGLLLAVAAVLEAVERKGLLTREEILDALAQAQERAVSDPGRPAGLSDANVDAVRFPIRFLASSLDAAATGGGSFSEIARKVGRAKEP